MELKTELKYGVETDAWEPDLLTAILQIVFSPLAFVLGLVLAALVVLLDFLQMGSNHIVLRSTPKPIRMPDGEIRLPTKSNEESN